MMHRHHWEEVSRTYTAPPSRMRKVAYDFAEIAMFGQTVIELRCKDCGDLKHKRIIGRTRAP